jgi:hypothetical protein
VQNLQCTLSIGGSCSSITFDLLPQSAIADEFLRITFPFDVIHDSETPVKVLYELLFQTTSTSATV